MLNPAGAAQNNEILDFKNNIFINCLFLFKFFSFFIILF